MSYCAIELKILAKNYLGLGVEDHPILDEVLKLVEEVISITRRASPGS